MKAHAVTTQRAFVGFVLACSLAGCGAEAMDTSSDETGSELSQEPLLGTLGQPLPSGDAPGKWGCINDCLDEFPDLSQRQCSEQCRDKGGTPGTGGGQLTDPSVTALCYSGYAICLAVGNAPVVGGVHFWVSCLTGGPCSCEDILDSCLHD